MLTGGRKRKLGSANICVGHRASVTGAVAAFPAGLQVAADQVCIVSVGELFANGKNCDRFIPGVEPGAAENKSRVGLRQHPFF